jgi:hypothetical protein
MPESRVTMKLETKYIISVGGYAIEYQDGLDLYLIIRGNDDIQTTSDNWKSIYEDFKHSYYTLGKGEYQINQDILETYSYLGGRWTNTALGDTVNRVALYEEMEAHNKLFYNENPID